MKKTLTWRFGSTRPRRFYLGDYYSGFGSSDSEPIKMATQRVLSLLTKAIFTTIVSGVAKSMPMGPNSQPQKIRDMNTIRGDRPNPCPINLGSMMFPKMKLIST